MYTRRITASTGRVEITAATPCNARADFSIFPDCDGEIVCDTNDALTTESRTEFNAENASSESLLGVISDSGASSSQKTTGKISEAGRDMAALMSAGGDVDSNGDVFFKSLHLVESSSRQRVGER